MSKYDIAITLFTIVYGLILTDLFLSLHKLIRASKNIKWHWLPLLAAWYLFLIILKNWWDLAFFQSETDWITIFYFIAYGHLLLLIFLAVATALPDDIRSEHIDLRNYYFTNNRYFWGLMSSVLLMSQLIGIFKHYHLYNTFSLSVSQIIGSLVLLILTLLLAVTKKYWIHSVTLLLFVFAIILEIFGK